MNTFLSPLSENEGKDEYGELPPGRHVPRASLCPLGHACRLTCGIVRPPLRAASLGYLDVDQRTQLLQEWSTKQCAPLPWTPLSARSRTRAAVVPVPREAYVTPPPITGAALPVALSQYHQEADREGHW